MSFESSVFLSNGFRKGFLIIVEASGTMFNFISCRWIARDADVANFLIRDHVIKQLPRFIPFASKAQFMASY